MAHRRGAAEDIDLFVGDVQVLHGRHGNDRKGFVDLEQIHIGRFPSQTLHQFGNRADRRGREPLRLLRMGAVADDPRLRRDA